MAERPRRESQRGGASRGPERRAAARVVVGLVVMALVGFGALAWVWPGGSSSSEEGPSPLAAAAVDRPGDDAAKDEPPAATAVREDGKADPSDEIDSSEGFGTRFRRVPSTRVPDPQLEAAGRGRLHVRVVDGATGTAIRGAQLCLEPRRIGEVSAAVASAIVGRQCATDDEGRADVELPAGFPLSLVTRTPNVNVTDVKLDVEALAPDEERDLLVELAVKRAPQMHLRVVAAADGRPLSEATITSGVRGTGDASATTDGDGRAALDVTRGFATIGIVRAPGFGPAWLEVGPGSHATRDEAVEVRLAVAGRLVIHARTGGKALPWLRVDVTARLGELLESAGSVGVTERVREEGVVIARWIDVHADEVIFEDLPAIVLLEVDAWGSATEETATDGQALEVGRGVFRREQVDFREELARERVRLSPGETRGLSWLVPALGSVRGRLVGLDETRVGSARGELVPADGRRATRNPRGFEVAERGFFINEVPAGRWRAIADVNRIGGGSSEPFTVAEGQTVEGVTIHLERFGTVEGRVVDVDGHPAADVDVTVRLEGSDFGTSSRTAADGTFILQALPDRPLRVRAAADRWQDEGPKSRGGAELLLASLPDHPVELTLVPAAMLAGRCQGASGSERFVVLLFRHEMPLGAPPVASLLANPDFHYRPLSPGTYDLVATGSSGSFGVLRDVVLVPGEHEEGLVIPLAPAVPLSVRLLRPEGPYAPQIAPAFLRATTRGAPLCARDVWPGETVKLFLPPGRVELTLFQAGERVVEKVIELKAGSTVDAELLLPR